MHCQDSSALSEANWHPEGDLIFNTAVLPLDAVSTLWDKERVGGIGRIHKKEAVLLSWGGLS